VEGAGQALVFLSKWKKGFLLCLVAQNEFRTDNLKMGQKQEIYCFKRNYRNVCLSMCLCVSIHNRFWCRLIAGYVSTQIEKQGG
jgi:hypothetical protein